MSLTSYLITCLTEGVRRSTPFYDDGIIPTGCPEDTSHTIDPLQTTVSDIREKNSVIIQHGQDSDLKFYHYNGQTFDIPTGVGVSIYDYYTPYPMLPRLVTVTPSSENVGDVINCYAMPDFPIGILTAGCSTGATSLNVNSTVTANMSIGFKVKISNSGITNDCGYCVDKTSDTINIQTPTSNSFGPGSVVKLSIPRIENCLIMNTQNIIMGSNNLTSVKVPRGTLIRIYYTNNNGLAKTFHYNLEFIYGSSI